MKITLPPITPGEWGTDRRFPATVIAGTPEETSRGLMVSVVCRVQGQVLPTYKHDLKAIAALPRVLEALANVVLSQSDPDSHANALQEACDALLLAGAVIEEHAETQPVKATVWGNQFTREYWRGTEDRCAAADYVTNTYPGPVYYGRIGGKVTEDQAALEKLYYELIAELNMSSSRWEQAIVHAQRA
jgi:hypothetical protein